MVSILIKNATIINEGKQINADVFIKNGFIEQIGTGINPSGNYKEINAEGKWSHQFPQASIEIFLPEAARSYPCSYGRFFYGG